MTVTLAQVLADPGIVRTLTADQVLALRFEAYHVLDALASAYVTARTREQTQQAFPRQFIGGLIDAAEVARLLNVTKPAVYALMRSGELPSVKVGKKYLKVPVAAVAEYLSRLVREGEADRPRRNT